MSARFRLPALLLSLWGIVGCSKVCTTDLRPGIVVNLIGGDAGTTGCGLLVHATSPGYSDDFDCEDAGGACYCAGAWERAGTYTVTATVDGRVVDSRSVTVHADECHVQTVEYDVSSTGDAR